MSGLLESQDFHLPLRVHFDFGEGSEEGWVKEFVRNIQNFWRILPWHSNKITMKCLGFIHRKLLNVYQMRHIYIYQVPNKLSH